MPRRYSLWGGKSDIPKKRVSSPLGYLQGLQKKYKIEYFHLSMNKKKPYFRLGREFRIYPPKKLVQMDFFLMVFTEQTSMPPLEVGLRGFLFLPPEASFDVTTSFLSSIITCLVVEPTHLKSKISSKWVHLCQVGTDENKTSLSCHHLVTPLGKKSQLAGNLPIWEQEIHRLIQGAIFQPATVDGSEILHHLGCTKPSK